MDEVTARAVKRAANQVLYIFFVHVAGQDLASNDGPSIVRRLCISYGQDDRPDLDGIIAAKNALPSYGDSTTAERIAHQLLNQLANTALGDAVMASVSLSMAIDLYVQARVEDIPWWRWLRRLRTARTCRALLQSRLTNA